MYIVRNYRVVLDTHHTHARTRRTGDLINRFRCLNCYYLFNFFFSTAPAISLRVKTDEFDKRVPVCFNEVLALETKESTVYRNRIITITTHETSRVTHHEIKRCVYRGIPS